MKPPTRREPLPLADTWAVNLSDVLLELVQGGASRVVLELASQPDAGGSFRLLVFRAGDVAEQPGQIIAPVSHGQHDPLVLTCGRTNLYAMREACKP